MDVVIAFLLLIIAGAAYLNKPLQINVTHKHEVLGEKLIEVPENPEEPKGTDAPVTNMDDIMRAIHEVMGVEHSEQND